MNDTLLTRRRSPMSLFARLLWIMLAAIVFWIMVGGVLYYASRPTWQLPTDETHRP